MCELSTEGIEKEHLPCLVFFSFQNSNGKIVRHNSECGANFSCFSTAIITVSDSCRQICESADRSEKALPEANGINFKTKKIFENLKSKTMSGHNPHGRLGQPNASFNHLQVPFIPRQPQLAHVHMNDSILRSSPLNWHHQTDAAFLNYMSTQHKTVRESVEPFGVDFR